MSLLVYIILLGFVCIATLVGFFLTSRKNKVLSNKTIILYYLSVSIIISACGFIGLVPAIVQTGSSLYFFLLQLFFLGLGVLVSFLWQRNTIEELKGQTSRLSGILFVATNALMGMVGFTLVFYYCSSEAIAPYYGLAVVPFVLPHFLKASYAIYTEIPQEIYKIWYFPEDDIDLGKVDMSTIFMLELEYSKSINDSRLTNTKLRAPVGMKFGDWFRAFVEDHNYKHDMDPIHYQNIDGTPQGWIFYVKPSFLGTPRYIDPDLTIAQNKLSEKKAIIVRRAGYVQDDV